MDRFLELLEHLRRQRARPIGARCLGADYVREVRSVFPRLMPLETGTPGSSRLSILIQPGMASWPQPMCNRIAVDAGSASEALRNSLIALRVFTTSDRRGRGAGPRNGC